ncbi:hypothetical protein ASPFODRAFT_55183, partial [Aspergillus luchuensis CBS 106.47]
KPMIPSKRRRGFSRAGMFILRNAFPTNNSQKILPSPGLVVLAVVVIGTCQFSEHTP